jgi:ketosteroid isomerase-like protein
MAEARTIPAEIELLERVYAAFNRKEIETVLTAMHANVDWPNGMEGGRVLGTAAVREYWKRQFEVLDPNVAPTNFTREPDGRIAVDVHQVVHDKGGKLVVDQMVQHVYEIRDGLIQNMEIREVAKSVKGVYHEGH